MVRRIRSVIAAIVDLIVAPFGWNVYVVATHGEPGIDAWCLVRRCAGEPRPRRLRRRPAHP